ncbi:MAG: maltose alpha-D-glucosyltransferase [Elusimicrobia bacterium RBG_16_66_12]|nr:MAG: maltose alpha-D-glucosyltransferase [Elusimicrobia bacterium RBG_16_66_12]
MSARSADWYKDAVIYEVRVRSFFDANDDGKGDLRGLTSKLDYLKDLGVTALWLLPICPSPMRDDGYDISDYRNVHPDVGTLEDFRIMLDAAHERGMRVIMELVLNHTSDQHPWFQRARSAQRGHPDRDWYVWSDDPKRYKGARVVFKDFEKSNWTWDEQAGAHYWHRFYHHQPDLNFDHPTVREAMLAVVDHWFGLGVDGLRLDAVPYLYEREGTDCENLPETHEFLRQLRARVDALWPGRMLLAEANQWPEDAVKYFGKGDECHMAFHFPLMPRLFMAMRLEERRPITEILARTPDIPTNCQWALFLRNHDELTLEMVTADERDYLWKEYAKDPQARLNMGIRRRLAPLLDNDRRRIELMSSLLFSLPGTPVLYYGDEIGMGDDLNLGDRNGVRTPMQWTPGPNAGFSSVDASKLLLPLVGDPAYHWQTVNVSVQHANESSLLHWTRRLLHLRARHPAFGRGSTVFVDAGTYHALAFVREHEGDRVLVVCNLSRYTRPLTLDLARWKGAVPVELFGRVKFPPIKGGGYPLTLGPRGFCWFALETA